MTGGLGLKRHFTQRADKRHHVFCLGCGYLIAEKRVRGFGLGVGN